MIGLLSMGCLSFSVVFLYSNLDCSYFYIHTHVYVGCVSFLNCKTWNILVLSSTQCLTSVFFVVLWKTHADQRRRESDCFFFFSRFRVGASHLGHNLAVLSEMERLDTVKNTPKKRVDLSQENERKQLSRGSSVFESGGRCMCVFLLGFSEEWNSVTVPPSDRVQICISRDCVKRNRAQISSDLLSAIKVSLWENIYLHGCGEVLKTPPSLFPILSITSHSKRKGMAPSFFLLEKGGLWQRPDVLCQVKYVSAYTIFALELFLSLGFLGSIHSKTTQTPDTARKQWSYPPSCCYTLENKLISATHTSIHSPSPVPQQSRH